MQIAKAYYNEINRKAAAALRQLIADGVIAPGDVDERSIKEVKADELSPYTQCHFFAGGGVWSVAARLAGWPDSRPIWTGSCPCQPFSVAGKKRGTDDARHLWPDFRRLISAARPAIIVGEQVAAAAGYGWFDGVRADLAAENYASRAADVPACAVDAPHERNRLWWIAVANANGTERQSRSSGAGFCEGRSQQYGREPSNANGAMVDTACQRRSEGLAESEIRCGRPTVASADLCECGKGSMADCMCARRDAAAFERICGIEEGAGPRYGELERLHGVHGRNVEHADSKRREEQCRPIAIRTEQPCAQRANGRNGSWWAGAEWIICHDGKARRAKSGIPLLVNGLVGRVDAWSIIGNAISPILAAEVIGAILDCEAEGGLL